MTVATSAEFRLLSSLGLEAPELDALARLPLSPPTPLQRAALRAGGSSGALVFGPTGSGKTFVFVLRALARLRRGSKAVVLLSTRAQEAEFERRYFPLFASLGWRCVSSARSRELRLGLFDLAACVYERFFAALPSLLPLLSSPPALVACDDVELLYDRERGPVVDAVLGRLKAVPAITLLLFSASLSCDDPLVRWSGLPLVAGDRRAVPLRRGVFSPPVFRYEEYNSGRRGEETIPGDFPDGGGEHALMRALALAFHRMGEVTFVFARDRNGTRLLARPAAAELRAEGLCGPLPPEIAALPPTFASALLRELTPCGVAVHNSDLTAAERSAVETLVLDGRVRTVFCTPTLGTGVNFPVDNVIVESVRWETEGDEPVLRRMTPAEFESLAGRAGRFGLSKREGRAMVVAPPSCAERVMDELLAPFSPSRPAPPPLDERLYRTAYLCRDDEPPRALARSPLGAPHPAAERAWAAVSSGPLGPGRKGHGLSPVGEICASSGLSLDTAQRLAEYVASRRGDPPAPFEWCWTVCGFRELVRLLPSAAGADAPFLMDLAGGDSACAFLPLPGGFDYSDLRRLLGAAVLLRLHEGATGEWIELNLHVSAGVQQRLAAAARSLSRTAARVAAALGAGKLRALFASFCDPSAGASSPGEEDGPRPQLRLLGEGRDRSGCVSLAGRKLRLRLSTYRILERLYAEGGKNGGWVRAAELVPDGDSERARKYVSHLRSELRPLLGFNPVENDGEGCYRLAPALLPHPSSGPASGTG